MEFLKNILFFCRRFVAKKWLCQFWKRHVFTNSAAVHNLYITIPPWNLDLTSKNNKIWENGKRMEFLRHVLFFLSKASLQINITAKIEQFYTVAQDGVRGGPVLNLHVWYGQGLEDPCFFGFRLAYVGWTRSKRFILFWNFSIKS